MHTCKQSQPWVVAINTRFATRRSSQVQSYSSANALNVGLLLARLLYISIWNVVVVIWVHEPQSKHDLKNSLTRFEIIVPAGRRNIQGIVIQILNEQE